MGGEQGRIQQLGQGHVQGVDGGKVGAQLPGPGPEGTARVAAQAEAVGGGQCLQGVALLQRAGEHEPAQHREQLGIDHQHQRSARLAARASSPAPHHDRREALAGLMAQQAPQPLAAHHRGSGFDCGDDSLNQWLRQRALANQASGATRTFVVCDDDGDIRAFVALASGTVAVAASPGRFRRNMVVEPVAIGGFQSIRSGMQCVMHDIGDLLAMARRQPKQALG